MPSGAYEEEVAIGGVRYRVRCDTCQGAITQQCAGCGAEEEHVAEVFERAEITEVPATDPHHASTTVIVTSTDLRDDVLKDYILGRRQHQPGTSPDPEELVWRAGVAHAARTGGLNQAAAWVCDRCLDGDAADMCVR